MTARPRFVPLLAVFATLCGFALAPREGAAQAWPAKPVRWIVPYAAGGFADTTARRLGTELAKAIGQPVVIENRAGAGGVLGTDAIAKAAPDGYTIGSGNFAPLAVNPTLMARLPYDAAADIAPVLLVETGPMILTVPPASTATTVRELVAQAKANPRAMTFGSSGIGGTHHLSGEMLRERAGIEIVHVPYKGGAQAAADLLGGHLAMMFEMGYAALPSIQAGKIRALAVTASRRLQALPNVPTMAEAGFPGFEAYNWQGVVVPANTPVAVIERLNREINAIIARPDIRQSIESTGSQLGGGSPADFAKFIAAEREKWGRLIRSSGIRAE